MNLDFETSAAIELSKVGVYKYTTHSSFRITTLLYKLNDDPQYYRWVGFYHPELNKKGTLKAPDNLVNAILAGEEIIGWNVSFERHCIAWMALQDPRLANVPLEQYVCTMQRAAIVGLPLGLANCGAAVRCHVQKDMDGKRVMLQTAKPRNGVSLTRTETVRRPKKGDAELTWYTRDSDPGMYATLDSYCLLDVKSEIAIANKLPEMTRGERLVALADARINNRGIPVDRPALERALQLINFVKEDGDRQISELTDGAVPKATALPKLKEWLALNGVEMDAVNKQTIPLALSRTDLTPQVRAVLELRLEGGASSISKVQTMLQHCCADDRLRGQFQYSGAHTGRYAGRGSQPQNFFKGWGLEEQHTPFDAAPPEQTKFFELLMQDKPVEQIAADLRAEFGNLVNALKNSLRGYFKAPEGYDFYVCDFSGIENRVVAWLADEEILLETFRKNGDPYITTAAGIYGVPPEEVTKAQRQLGKVCVLAAQFGQGPSGFQATCKTPWGIDISLKEARATIKGYRETYSNLKKFWYDLYQAMMSSVATGQSYNVGKLWTEYDGTSLKILMPSGRRIYYWNPVVKEHLAPWSYHHLTLNFTPTEDQIEEWGIQELGDHWKLRDMDAKEFKSAVAKDQYSLGEYVSKYCFQLFHEKSHNNGWPHIDKEDPSHVHSTWHGVAVENVTQAVARDVLAEAVLRIERAGYELIGYVHDELIALVPRNDKTKSYEDFERIMLQTPKWCAGLPINGEGYVATRYRK